MAKTAPKFKINIYLKDKKVSSTGDTILEAIQNIDLNYLDIKTKGEVEVITGKKKVKKLFFLRPLRLLTRSKSTQTLWAKYFNTLMEATNTSGK